MAETPPGDRLAGMDADFDDTEDYIHGLLAAIRTHQHLTGRETLEVEIDPDSDLPLAQRMLLK